jgi:hypothetical protein
VVAEQIAAVGDVPDDVARPAEFSGSERPVLDLGQRTIEEE